MSIFKCCKIFGHIACLEHLSVKLLQLATVKIISKCLHDLNLVVLNKQLELLWLFCNLKCQNVVV